MGIFVFRINRSRRVPSARQLQLQLLQAQQVTDNYREQCVHMEQELCQLREHADASKDLFGKRSSKMVGRLKLMNERYEALEKRRRLEIEGYKTDIKMLRERLKEVEKQLYKVVHAHTIVRCIRTQCFIWAWGGRG